MTALEVLRSDHAIVSRRFLSEKTVQAYVRNIFTKLDLRVSCDDHRRVLVVLQYLRSPPGSGEDGADGVAAGATLAPS
jgi:hypothetical protein